MHQIATIPYLETDGFLSIFDSSTNTIYACPKSICEIFGIDWRSQRAKLSDNAARWQFRIIMVRLPGDDRKRKHGVIPDKKVRSWVCSINPEKVRQDIREQLIAFQDECDSILVDYWTKGVAINPRHNLQLNDNLKHFIAETVGTSIREAMRELAVALRETFVTKDTFQGFTDQYERRLTALEQDRGVATLEIPTSAQISVEQAQMLRKLVKEKGGSRKGICHIWKKFRQKFQVESYHRLPNCKFQDALRWVNSL